MQSLMNENMRHVKAAVEDQKYQEYMKKQYTKLQNDIETARKQSVGLLDADIVLHYRTLDKWGLKAEEWKCGPIENPEHDFVAPLLNSFLSDLEKR